MYLKMYPNSLAIYPKPYTVIRTYNTWENIIPYIINIDLLKPSLKDLDITANAPGPGLSPKNITKMINPK